MAFDPDKYLAEKEDTLFDPDAFLAQKDEFNPDAYLGQSRGLSVSDVYSPLGAGGMSMGKMQRTVPESQDDTPALMRTKTAGAGLLETIGNIAKTGEFVTEAFLSRNPLRTNPMRDKERPFLSQRATKAVVDATDDLVPENWDEARQVLRERSSAPSENLVQFLDKGGMMLLDNLPNLASSAVNPALGATVMFSNERNISYEALKEIGVDEDIAQNMASTYAMLATPVEYAENVGRVSSAFGANPKKTILSSIAKKLKTAGINVAEESVQKFFEDIVYNEAVKLHNERYGTGLPLRDLREGYGETVEASLAMSTVLEALGLSTKGIRRMASGQSATEAETTAPATDETQAAGAQPQEVEDAVQVEETEGVPAREQAQAGEEVGQEVRDENTRGPSETRREEINALDEPSIRAQAEELGVTFEGMQDMGDGTQRPLFSGEDVEGSFMAEEGETLGEAYNRFVSRNAPADTVDTVEKRKYSMMSENPQVRKLFSEVDNARQKLGEPAPQTIEQWDKEATKKFNEDPDGSYLSIVSGELDMANPVNVRLAQKAMTERGADDLASGDEQRIERAVTASYNIRQQGTSLARAMAARRDPLQKTDEYIKGTISAMITAPTESEARTLDTVNDKKRMAMIRKHSKRARKIVEELNREGISLKQIGADGEVDLREVSEALRIVKSNQATMADKEFEFWRNSILSAIPTQGANVIGNTLNGAYQYGILRPVEAVMNAVTGNRIKGGTTFADLRSIYKAMLSSKTWYTGWRNAVEAFVTELPVTEGVKVEQATSAIKGKKGRLIRIPQRFLLAADEFAKGLVVQTEVGAQAAMLGRQQGLEGDALDLFVQEQMNDPESQAWENAVTEARDITFQSRTGPVSRKLMELRNQGGMTGFVSRHIIPFIVTPTNIVKTGIRRTPLGSLALPYTLYRADMGQISSQQALSRVAEQFVAWGLFAFLYSVANDLDDDGQPKYITGSSPISSERGRRDFMYRNAPPQSIKLPGTDTWVSYSRIEPLATSLSTMIDLLQNPDESTGKKAWTTLTGLARDKTFMRGISDVIEIVEKRDLNSLVDWSSNFVSSYMPNIVRSTLRAGDPRVTQYMVEDPDDHFKDWIKQTTRRALPYRAFMPPAKVDIFGRDVTKGSVNGPKTDFAYRSMVPVRIQNARPLERVDRFLLNYNTEFPDSQYWPTLPSPTMRYQGKEYRLTEDEYHEFLRVRGEYIARRQGFISPERPTKKMRQRLTKLFTEATKYAKNSLGINRKVMREGKER